MKKKTLKIMMIVLNIIMMTGCAGYSNVADIPESSIENENSDNIAKEKNDNDEAADDATTSQTSMEQTTSNENNTTSNVTKEEPDVHVELTGYDMKFFRDSLNRPCISAYLAIKNTGNVPLSFSQLYFDFEDDNKRLLGTDRYTNAIPEVVLPGQVGYVYSYYYDLSGIDYSNGFKPIIQGLPEIVSYENIYFVKMSDISLKSDYGNWITVTARGTNESEVSASFSEPGAIFFDKDDNVIGFCYGMEDFPVGQTKSFEISGELMSSEFKPSDVKRAEVWCIGAGW